MSFDYMYPYYDMLGRYGQALNLSAYTCSLWDPVSDTNVCLIQYWVRV